MRCDLTATAAFLNAHTHACILQLHRRMSTGMTGQVGTDLKGLEECVCFPLIMIQALFALTTECFFYVQQAGITAGQFFPLHYSLKFRSNICLMLT